MGAVQAATGDEKISRVIVLDPLTPFTVYAKVPFAESANESVAVPTSELVIAAEFQSGELKAGPFVWYIGPE